MQLFICLLRTPRIFNLPSRRIQLKQGNQMFDMSFPNTRDRQEGLFPRVYDNERSGHSPSSVLKQHASKYYRNSFQRYRFGETLEKPQCVKTIISQLTRPVEASGVEVVYTNDISKAESWLRKHIVDCSPKAVGFDIEWRPMFVRGCDNKTAVLQLGVETSCLVLHIYHMRELPKSLVSILRDENVLKVGVGIMEDALKLQRHRGLICKGMTDIQAMGMRFLGMPPSAPKLGLKTMAERFAGIELEKSKKVAMSNWENFPLKQRQIEYAALDAWAGVKVYHAIKRREIERSFRQEQDARPPTLLYILLFMVVILLVYALPRS